MAWLFESQWRKQKPRKMHLLSQNPAVIKMAVQPPATGHLVGLEFLYARIPLFK